MYIRGSNSNYSSVKEFCPSGLTLLYSCHLGSGYSSPSRREVLSILLKQFKKGEHVFFPY